MTDDDTAQGAEVPHGTRETNLPPRASTVYIPPCVMWTERLLSLAYQCADGLVPGSERGCLP